MNDTNEPKGIRKLSIFVTADALLAAILLVWAQLWIQPSLQLWVREYGKGEPAEILDTFSMNVGIGLVWTYFAVFLALVALAWAGWRSFTTEEKSERNKTPDFSIGLFSASLVMAVLDVLQSFATNIKKLMMSGMPIYKPLELPENLLHLKPWCIGVVIALGVLIIIFSILGAKSHKYKLWLKAEAVAILIVGVFFLYILCIAQ
ncbi:MAG: hypothetical protein IMY77_03805 [Chloroflexi bacterium]|nr:hypothetical protein [Chloroflexota bacterium]